MKIPSPNPHCTLSRNEKCRFLCPLLVSWWPFEFCLLNILPCNLRTEAIMTLFFCLCLNFMSGLKTTCWQQSSNCNKIAVVDVTKEKNLIRSRNLTPTQFVCNHYIVLSSLPFVCDFLFPHFYSSTLVLVT